MSMKTSFWKRFLAAFLSFVMVMGMLPTVNLLPAAQADEVDTQTGETTGGEGSGTEAPNITGNYITLPITIRDFAADGMLFEYNEVYRKENTTYTEETKLTHDTYSVLYNPWYWDSNSAWAIPKRN